MPMAANHSSKNHLAQKVLVVLDRQTEILKHLLVQREPEEVQPRVVEPIEDPELPPRYSSPRSWRRKHDTEWLLNVQPKQRWQVRRREQEDKFKETPTQRRNRRRRESAKEMQLRVRALEAQLRTENARELQDVSQERQETHRRVQELEAKLCHVRRKYQQVRQQLDEERYQSQVEEVICD